MTHELSTTDDDRVQALYEPLTSLPFCTGVLTRDHDGRVFVDDSEQPRTALMLTRECWGYLVGDPDNAEFDGLRDTPEWQALVERIEEQ